MELKNILLAPALISMTAFSVNTATELTSEQAAALKPYGHIVVTGRFNAIGDAVIAIPRRVDKDGVASFYAVDTLDFGSGGSRHVVVDVYKADIEKTETLKNRVINGVMELPKDQAVLIEPYDTVTVQGFYRSQPEIDDAITKAAKERDIYSFYTMCQVNASQSGNQRVTAFTYKTDAKKCTVQNSDAILADSDAGRAALAAGGEAVKRAEILGAATAASPSAEVGRFFGTQSTRGGRYTVTLPDGTKIEELNKVAAAMTVPLDNIKFTGNHSNMTEVPYQVAERIAKKGAKYYHIIRQWSKYGNSMTISADLYR